MSKSDSIETSGFVRSVGAFIDARGLLPPRSDVVVGVSGGADSVALLDVLRRLAAEPARRYRLTAAHLNHCLRPDAQADADFVAALARRWDIPCVAARRDVAAEARAAGRGIEEAARAARYEFLKDAAAGAGASHVAVAHHADDNVETILYRIVRGTHLRGLAGIPPIRPLGSALVELRPSAGERGQSPADSAGYSPLSPPGPTPAPLLIRPLLERTRAEIEAYCRAADLPWRTDSTNVDTAYRRNFIRHELLPLLRSRLNRRADEALLRLAQAAAGAEEVLAGLARAALASAGLKAGRKKASPGATLDASALAKEHPLVQTVAMRIAMEGLGVPMRSLDADRLEDIRRMLIGAGPAGLALPGGWTIRVAKGRVEIAPPAPAAARSATRIPSESAPDVVVLKCPGRTRLADGRQVICRIEPFDADAFRKHCRRHAAGEELLDAGQVRGRLICRPRRRGDSFVPLGAPGRQSVSDFLTNLKLPAAEREAVRCICDDLGIVWLAPLRIDERAKVTNATREVFQITLRGSARRED